MMLIKKLFNSQRGAMFGLDARITLAILSGLSVVGGYSLVQKIGPARYAALAKDLRSVEGAIAQLQTDLRVWIFQATEDGEEFNALLFPASGSDNYVLSRFQSRWLGPYLNMESDQHKDFGTFSLIEKKADHTSDCDFTDPCFIWLQLTGVDVDYMPEVNKIIDERNGAINEATPESSGVFHYNTGTGTIYYKTLKRRG